MLTWFLLAAITVTDVEVIVFLGADCPLARLYANRLNALAERYPQVCFRGVNCSEQDSDAEVEEFGRRLRFSITKDIALARRLGATRSPEAFLLVSGRIVYQGRIDDQYTPGTNRSQPTRCDLEEALKEVLAGKPVTVPVTEATGCRLSIAAPASGKTTFEHAAPILHRKCAPCHRPGQVAPFSLLRYEDTVGWGPMMREVIESGRMPPWHADPRYGKFTNDRSLTAEERRTLLAWIDAGAPRGEREPSPPTFKDGWQIRADVVLAMERSFAVPAEGVLDYQEFKLPTGFKRDTWVQAVEVRPGNASVVHHIIAFLRPADGKPHTIYVTQANDYCLSGMVPGSTAEIWPMGIAKLIPAGWDIILSVHYQPNGTPQEDRSRIALQLADAATVRQQAATRVLMKPDLVLPPNEVTQVQSSWTLEEDLTLYALSPHMHLRGKSMRFEADGEILLDVPNFDINWQHGYVLEEPRRLAKGTTIRCTARFDNTAANPSNPDPQQTVRWGEQTTDEMFQGTFLVVRTHEDRLAFAWRPLALAVSCFLLLCFFTWRRLKIR